MSKLEDGGPAFPVQIADFISNDNKPGMSLRDWFAGQEHLTEFDHPESSVSESMTKSLAIRERPKNGWAAKTPEELLDMLRWEAEWRAALKYIRADAMLAERSKAR